MEFKVRDIAALLNGTVDGDGEISVNNLSKIDQGVPGTLTFLSNPAYTKYIYTTEASAVIVSKDFQPEGELSVTLIRVEDPYSSLAALMQMYVNMKPQKRGIESPVYISEKAKIGEGCYIGAFTTIADHVVIGNNVKIYPNSYIGENVKIADNSTLFAGVKIYPDTVIGEGCTLHAGVVIGADGFGFAPNTEGPFAKIPQIGNVILEDHVEIGANTTIDCATMGSTIIRRGVKLDNLIQVGHNVEIGENTVIAALTGISGSSKIGRNCMIAGQVGIAGHITIGDNVRIGGQAGVMSPVADGSTIIGSPPQDAKDFMRSSAIFRKLPQLASDVSDLKKRMKKLDPQE